jgi:hypothetical protein
MDDYGQDYGYSDTTEEIPSWMGGNVDPATLQWYSGLNENNSGNAESMAGWTYKDGVWTDSKGQTYDTKTGTGSLADLFKNGGIGSMLGIAGAAGLAQQLLGGGGSGYSGYQGGIPKYAAQRTQYALPVVPLSAANQAKVTDQGIRNVFNQEGFTPDRMARSMYKYGISPERVAGIMNLPVADVQKVYHEALGPNQSLLGGMYGKYDQTTHPARGENNGASGMDYSYRRPGSGGITYFSPTKYIPATPSVAPTTTTTTAPATVVAEPTTQPTVIAAGGGMMYGSGGISSLGAYSDGGQLLRGPGDGVSDNIPATIGNKQPARLADGEFVVPARIVSELGNGSTEAGARKLYAMMDRIKKTRAKAKNIAANTKADKHLPA